MKQYMCFLMVIWGMVIVTVSCFHPDVSELGSAWGGIAGMIFVCGGYFGIMCGSKNE